MVVGPSGHVGKTVGGHTAGGPQGIDQPSAPLTV